jgi:uncharacterized MAPEG superfamily protein
MTIELWMLVGSVVLGLLQIIACSHSASLQRGYRWSASARDAAVPPLTGVAGRLERALRNFGETFPLFAAAVLTAHVAGKHGRLTIVGSELYLGARVGFVLLYAFGVPLLRSLAWNAATTGIALLLLALAL